MMDAGHSFAHFPQPTHFSVWTFAMIPFQISMAFIGQILTQQPQATHISVVTIAFFFFLIVVSMLYPPKFSEVTITGLLIHFCDDITNNNTKPTFTFSVLVNSQEKDKKTIYFYFKVKIVFVIIELYKVIKIDFV